MSGPQSFRRNAIASFFIARPIFAVVLAIATMLGGAAGLISLSISQYPDIAPTTIRVNATYAGATAEAVENSVTTVLESAMTGLEGLIYMESSSSSGSSSVSLTFDNSVDRDLAQVQVQNSVSRVLSRLPDSVQRLGVRVNRSTAGIFMVGNLVSTDGRYSSNELADIMSSRITDRVERIEGVGSIQVFGGSYAMRIWLDPAKLEQFQLMPSDVTAAVSAQNAQVSAGAIGSSPTTAGQQITAAITAQSQMTTVEQFQRIILKTAPNGALVRLGDVARVEIGLESYGRNSTYNNLPATGFGVQLANGANAVATSEAIHALLDGMQDSLPTGVKIVYSFETTPFVELAIEKVMHTLLEAIVLVFVVLLIFLQNLRATLIPMIAVPVVLLGTFGVLSLLGYSINMLTMFAMVLAIGLLVDDAIVVVENVERIMHDEGLDARAATEKSMGEITGALVGVGLVLSAVFLPMAFFAGSVGVIYRQFSVTIVTAMALSVLVAIVLTPALCAMLLRPSHGTGLKRWMGWFDRGFNALTRGYVGTVRRLVVRPLRMILVFSILSYGAYHLFAKLPSSFVPAEDQGVLMTQISLPPGANAARTQAVVDLILDYYLNEEAAAVESGFFNVGFSFGGSGENVAMGFVRLRDFSERSDPSLSAAAVAARAGARFRQIRDAEVFVLAPPAIQGMGSSSGFNMYLEDASGQGRAALNAASNQLTAISNADPSISNIRGATRAPDNQLHVEIDQEKAGAMGVTPSNANSVLSVAFAGSYVNDFLLNGESKRVYVQGDAPFRMQPEDIGRWHVRNSSGEMAPLSAIATTSWTQGPPSLARFNGTAAVSMQGAAAEGVSSGDAMIAMERLVSEMEGGYAASWSGLSYQERLAGSQEVILYAISLLVVFLCLAALYESWAIPFSVIFAVPLGILGAVAAANFFGQSNDVYFKVGLLTTMGLAAKNAILIVEFAKDLNDRGMSVIASVLEAARLRLRPIVMTSLAFSLGVTPLAVATGAGSGAQKAIGVGVLGGMIAATLLGIFFVPFLYVLVRRLSGGAPHEPPRQPTPSAVVAAEKARPDPLTDPLTDPAPQPVSKPPAEAEGAPA
ncbi:efflux RND transporter permease subunit [Neomegalonema perideroedes]|uniref:efflux RND transporter permease subunit n=1 Tax=Neomegalonema perideroedes TaxID=217219 RepID=UPI0003671797|nr:efflux RND transporter permease subunit [Neomegalonema perideroedes]